MALWASVHKDVQTPFPRFLCRRGADRVCPPGPLGLFPASASPAHSPREAGVPETLSSQPCLPPIP